MLREIIRKLSDVKVSEMLKCSKHNSNNAIVGPNYAEATRMDLFGMISARMT